VKRRPRVLFCLSLAALAAAMGACVWLLLQEPTNQRVKLPDGAVLALGAATYGREHEFTAGKNWQRMVLSVMPSAAQHGGQVVRTSTPEDALVFWVRKQGGSSYSLASVVGDHGPPILLQAVDNHGCRIDPGDLSWTADSGRRRILNFSDREVAMAAFRAFPRRERVVRCAIFPSSRTDHFGEANRLLAEFVARNPTPGPHPVWTPQPYPVALTAGKATFVLHRITHPQPETVWWGVDPDCAGPASAARFEVRGEGCRSGGWAPVRIQASDATGNLATTEVCSLRQDGQVEFNGLCVREAAWKLRVTFAPSLPRRVAPDWTWTVKGVTLLASGGQVSTEARVSRGGAELRFRGLGLPDSNQPEPTLYRFYVVHIDARIRGDGIRLTLVSVKDQKGRELALPIEEVSMYPTTYVLTEDRLLTDIPVHAPLDAKKLDLTFAVHKIHTVEFLASPR
jgi:hypothetical protein